MQQDSFIRSGWSPSQSSGTKSFNQKLAILDEKRTEKELQRIKGIITVQILIIIQVVLLNTDTGVERKIQSQLFHVFVVPELKDNQRPEQLTMVVETFEMLFQEFLDVGVIEEAVIFQVGRG